MLTKHRTKVYDNKVHQEKLFGTVGSTIMLKYNLLLQVFCTCIMWSVPPRVAALNRLKKFADKTISVVGDRQRVLFYLYTKIIILRLFNKDKTALISGPAFCGPFT